MADQKPGQNVVPTQPQEKAEEDMSIGEFIDLHSLSSEAANAKRDMNNDQIAERLGISTAELTSIQTELGHKLPEGAN